jgi:predicted NodU family carbamoyl transferase
LRILAMKPGHDGHLALIEDRVLRWQVEAEKDSFPRYETITPDLFLRAAALLDDIPDVVAVGGWVKGIHSVEPPVNGGYYGWEGSHAELSTIKFMGRNTTLFQSTHERSHIFCSFGLSPFPNGEPCYALIWEGNLGCFYKIEADLTIRRLGWPLVDPGNKYGYLFGISDPTFPSIKGYSRLSNAGKMMALAAFSRRDPLDADGERLVEELLGADGVVKGRLKSDFSWSRFYNLGVEHEDFKNLAGHFSDRVFNRFHDFARQNLVEQLPLVIGGGCGLNCEWNSRWLESGLFADVFVPPCTNDSGSALGTGIEAQAYLTGSAKIDEWDVYTGEEFICDSNGQCGAFVEHPMDPREVAAALAEGEIIAWVQGRYEMGPRALGNRSILAEPFLENSRHRLNLLKKREDYRPIACICLEDEADRYFECSRPSPHMLYFHKIRDRKLRCISHVDDSCRVQTVRAEQNRQAHCLLKAFSEVTGYGVLANTSLNFNGRGFINRMSDLLAYSTEVGLDGFVVGDRFFRREARTSK